MKRLKGSTLVEGIVAMVIILTCATIAFSAISRQKKGVNSMLRTQAEMNMSYIVAQAKQSGKLLDNTVEFGNMHITMEISGYKHYKGLALLVCEAYTLQKEFICDYKEIIPYDRTK